MRNFLTLFMAVFFVTMAFSQGAPSTHFNIFVPPNNLTLQRNVALIVTAIYDSTTFHIIDDNMDGDNDDSVDGLLMSGQSYILYIKDNGINDDASGASGGTLKRDGDYFIVNSDKLVFASMSTDSDWQHSFVPSVNKKSVGEKFIIYAPKVSSSLRDLNVFAFEDNTTITVSKISKSVTTQTGYTNVDMNERTVVLQKTINRGQDLIHYFQEGRNIMLTGETYLVESNKGISMQYGALYQNERDGGSFVPSSNGSSTGDLFYFAVPYQSGGEQEIRVVSWDNSNNVVLERYQNGTWVNMKNWSLNRLAPADWVGKQNGNVSYPTVFRVTCTAGKKVSVFEANWMETGAITTSDMASTVSSEAGTDAGKEFLVYMLPPGQQTNVVNPFTGALFGGSFTHFYLHAGNKAANVTIKDAKTNGAVINRTYNVAADRYADAFFSEAEWKSIYNGTGQPTGAERPYVLIESTENISIVSTNFNDNWMMYFGSSLEHSFTQESSSTGAVGIPGDTLIVTSNIVVDGNGMVENTNLEVNIGSGAIPVKCKFKNKTDNTELHGVIDYRNDKTVVKFDDVPDLDPQKDYEIETKVLLSCSHNDGSALAPGTVVIVETIVSGKVDGENQQSVNTQGIQNKSDDLSNLLFTACGTGNMVNNLSDSWNSAWVDVNNDGREDLFVADKNDQKPNQLYLNNGNGNFSAVTSGPLVNTLAHTVSSAWADINNDGLTDVFVVNATGKRSMLYRNTGGGNFIELPESGIDVHPEYFHGASWADFDNDGFVDLIVTNFFETRFHQLYRNKGNFVFEKVENTPITQESERSTSPVIADYNNDGLPDVFIPNGNNRPNSLFKNLGGFQFEKVKSGAIATDADNSVGAAWGDYDNDGYVDLFVTNASGQDDRLYRNNGNGSFSSENTALVCKDKGHGHGASWVDIDNDMDLELMVTNDQGTSLLYINDGEGNFTRKMDELVAADLGNAYGQAWADYNKDGFMDVYVSTHSGDKNKLFCNQGNGNTWISIQLKGTQSNASAIGAKVRLKSGGVWQVREVQTCSGFGSQSSLKLHFGLQSATSIDSMVVYWPSGYIQTITNGLAVNTFVTIAEEAANLLKGVTFNDKNANGVRDNGEENVGNINLKINPTGVNLSSNADGQFRIRLAKGSYSILATNLSHWTAQGARNITFQGNSDSLVVDIPLQSVGSGHDLSLTFATTAWRRGFTNTTSVQVFNLGNVPAYNVSLEMNYPSGAHLIASGTNYTVAGNHTYRWPIDEIPVGGSRTITIIDSIGLEISTGQTLAFSGSVTANGTDLDPLNNNRAEMVEVVGAIDPNDILVFPKGDGPEGYIAPAQELTYTIRFQNQGTYPATYVFIENQLPNELDYSTFEILASSHAYQYKLSADGLLKVSYLNINLPDSVSNEVESHGYLKYRIFPKKDQPGGTRIYNQAGIVFDFEAPVITNTVLNTLKFNGRGRHYQLAVYPNPASERTHIAIDKAFFSFENVPLIQSYRVLDTQGRVVLEQKLVDDFETDIEVSELLPGSYLIQAIDFEGNTYTGFLIKK